MFLSHGFRETFFRYPYLETTLLMAIYLFIGYLLNPEDICMFNAKLSFLTIILAIITLFHGISSGILAMIIIGLAMKMTYMEFAYEVFLKEFILVLIFGEFHYYWNRAISQHKVKSEFTNKKLSELGKAFYMIKVSHDQIEKSYVRKPMSLRNSICLIKNTLKMEDSKKGYEEFLSLIQKTVNIECAYLISIEKDKTSKILSQTNDCEGFDLSDLMVEKAIEKKVPIYVSSNSDNHASKYLAVIPAVSNNEISGLLVIETMPFLSFNKDNFITVSILMSYFFDELYKMNTLKSMENICIRFQENFRFEVYRQYKFYESYNIDSTILVFKSYDKLKTHLLIDVIVDTLRTLEIYSSVEGDTVDIIGILFPFVDRSSVKGFLDRIDIVNNNIEYTSFSLANIDLISSYMDS